MTDATAFSPDAWRMRALAVTVGRALQTRFGEGKLHTIEQINTVCDECQVHSSARAYAVAMFAPREEAEAFFASHGLHGSPRDLRELMARQIFFSHRPELTFEPDDVDFHEAARVGGPAYGEFAPNLPPDFDQVTRPFDGWA